MEVQREVLCGHAFAPVLNRNRVFGLVFIRWLVFGLTDFDRKRGFSHVVLAAWRWCNNAIYVCLLTLSHLGC